MDILQTIVENKRLEVGRQKDAVPLESMLNFGTHQLNRRPSSMRRALQKSSTGIIAEFKRRSPSKGWLYPDAKVEDVVPVYEQAGASACSILTDSEFFGGSFRDLRTARELVELPLLRKDFIIDEYQIYQARALGADAILLIAAILTEGECRKFAALAHQLDLETLLEIHDESELSYLNYDVDMLGVNNRSLGTFHTDVEHSFLLAEKMKQAAGQGSDAPVLISESGISDTAIVSSLRQSGFQGFLMGEIFMKTKDPGLSLRDFIKEITV
ncbi:MAG: indole-3-glycerol phosphate synthase TrpC [Tannerella sp.]|jgi:indole-3-glycerol phosphate synthase|nr:indole-3-glycerol phosphate synthase TrpC [Tannerella sp.]